MNIGDYNSNDTNAFYIQEDFKKQISWQLSQMVEECFKQWLPSLPHSDLPGEGCRSSFGHHTHCRHVLKPTTKKLESNAFENST